MKARWMKVRRLAAVALALLMVSTGTGQALARDDGELHMKAEAKARFVAGQSHYNLNEFAEALVEFKEAYRLLPDPVFLYNSGQCERQLGHLDEAIRFYRSFLREQPKAANRQEVVHKIEEMEVALKSKPSEPEKAPAGNELGQAGGVVIATGVAAEPAPAVAESALPASPASPLSSQATPAIALAASAPMASEPASLPRADLTSAPTVPPAPEPPRWYRRWWVWAGTAALAAGAGVAIYAATSSHASASPGATLGTKAVF
jgi:tetratricopeptide (TPR) repeat protein